MMGLSKHTRWSLQSEAQCDKNGIHSFQDTAIFGKRVCQSKNQIAEFLTITAVLQKWQEASSWRRMYSLFSCWRTTLGSSTDMDFPEVLSPLSDEQSPHGPATKHCKSPKLCCLATRGPNSPFCYLAKTLKRQRLHRCSPGLLTNHTCTIKEDFQ